MTQAEDLIHDLDSFVIGRVFCNILVVAFKNEYKTIYHHDPEGVKKLTTMIHDGGLPIGFVKAVEINGGWKFLSQPLPEFKGKEHREVKKFLEEYGIMLNKKLLFGTKGT
jgi:hypothetical protein